MFEVAVALGVGSPPRANDPNDPGNRQMSVGRTDRGVQVVVSLVPLGLKIRKGPGQFASERGSGKTSGRQTTWPQEFRYT